MNTVKSSQETGSAKQAAAERRVTTVATAGLKKHYAKSRNLCKVTFTLPKMAATHANSVSLVGDFNNWSGNAHPMKKLESGDFTATVELEPGREYQFRYLIDGSRWENDWNADKYVRSPFGDSDNSVVIV